MKLSKNSKIAIAIILVLVAAFAWQKYNKNKKSPQSNAGGGIIIPGVDAASSSMTSMGSNADYGDMNWVEGPPGMEAFDDDAEDEAFEASMREEVYDTPTSHPLPLDFLGTHSKYVRKSLRV